ncbi:MAG: homocysteine S-methyltransferase family protein [Pseudomonadales bacterium]|nr:homocysteine S-methyltransferase family protein [Pseudomonadales bacterium]
MITILDGGMGAELIRRGAAASGGLWSAQALLDAPEAVVETHRDFIRAGARLIITNSYSSIPSYLAKGGIEDRYEELTALAGQLARRAAGEMKENVRVAGSLPPLSESYRPDLVPDDQQARSIYEAMAVALEPYVDIFVCETMSSIRESINACEAAKKAALSRKIPVYVSWTLSEKPGTGLRSGETLRMAFEELATLGIDGFLCNCTAPEAIEAALKELRGWTDKPIGGYPNRVSEVPEGWTLDNELETRRRVDLTPSVFVEFAKRCVENGATMFGGCCGVGPEYIAALAEAFPE